MPKAAVISSGDAAWADRMRRYEAYMRIDGLVAGIGLTPHWLGECGEFWYHADTEATPTLVDAATGATRPLFDRDEIVGAFAAATGRAVDNPAIEIDSTAADASGRRIRLSIDGVKVDWDRQQRRVLLVSAEDAARDETIRPRSIQDRFPETLPPMLESLAPDGEELLTLVGGNLALRRASGGAAIEVTKDASDDVRYATDCAVWSHDQRWVAAMRTDTSGVGRIPIVQWDSRREAVGWRPYARVADPIEATQAIIIDRATRVRRLIDTGAAPHFLFAHGFSGKPQRLLLSRQSRDGKLMELLAAEVGGGSVTTLLSEAASTYFGASILDEVGGGHCWPLHEGFLWLSERDGWRHIYYYDLNGFLIAQLTSGDFPVAQVVHVDQARGWVYFFARMDASSPYCASLHRVRLTGGDIERLTPEEADHAVSFSPDGRFFVDTYSTVKDPGGNNLRAADGRLIKPLALADISKLKAVGWRAPEPFTVTAADGATNLHGVLFRPHDWSPERRYPVVHYVYGGPQRAITPRSFLPVNHGAYIRFAQALAQLGFIVVVLDARGTPERSRSFQDAAHERLGSFEIDDYAGALKQLSERDASMDMNRVGVFGISFGGYFATRALLMRPDVYSVGVACAPAVEMRDVYAKASEVFLGDPDANAKAYDEADNTRYVERLMGKLLIIQGTDDVNVPFAQSMRLVSALIAVDKPFDLLVMPGLNHIFQPAEAPSVTFRHPYLWAAIRRYFVEHLKLGRAPEVERSCAL